MNYMTGVKEKKTLEISQIMQENHAGETITVNGAVHTIRNMGEVAFVVLRKREGLLQCVYEQGVTKFDLKELKENDIVEVSGKVHLEHRAPNGFEICLEDIKILSEPAAAM